MKRVGLVALVIATASAEPRKATPDKYTAAAGSAFEQAMASEDKGDLDNAAKLYERAFEISPHPNTAFNIAQLALRRHRVDVAAENFVVYLSLAGPAVADRAHVEATLDELARRPGTVALATLPAEAFAGGQLASYVLVDGEIVRHPGPMVATDHPGDPRGQIELLVTPGRHVIDLVTNLTFASVELYVPRGSRIPAQLRAPPRVDGNLIVTATAGIATRLAGKPLGGVRVVASGGALQVSDASYECPPVKLAAPRGDQIEYVHIAAAEQVARPTIRGPFRCRKLAVKQHVLAFGR